MKSMSLLFLPLVLAVAAPVSVLADTEVNYGEVVNLTAVSTAGDVVLCDKGISCSATTPDADIAGVGVFYLSFEGPYTPDVGPANAVTLLGGSQLSYFLTNYPGGFSANADYLDVSTNGLTSVGGYTFNTHSSVATPEPGALVLLTVALFGLVGAMRFRNISA
jgi:hypothetical protein